MENLIENITNVLKKIKYPGFSRDIISFGIVKKIHLDPDKNLNIEIFLKKTINSLEKTVDKSLSWRKYVNKQLETKYKKLFNKLDGLIYLKVQNFHLLRKWRLKQEKKLWLKASYKKNLKIMNKKEVINFMSTYQRVTQHMFNDMPKISSVIINLNNKHQINKIRFVK